MRKRDISIFLGLLMIFSTLAFSLFSKQTSTPSSTQPQMFFVTVWKGANVYAREVGNGSYIYYLQLSRDMTIPLRANPAEAEKVPSNFDPDDLYARVLTAQRIYYLFDPEDKQAVSLAYAELGRFIAGRSPSIFYGVSSPYSEENHTMPYHDPFNVSSGELAIYLRVANETRVELVNNTLVVEGSDRQGLLDAATKVGLVLARILR